MKKNIVQIILVLLASVGINGIVTAQIVVVGGASDVNGTYNNTFSLNGKPAYERSSGVSKDILWRSDVSEWRFTDGNGAGRYYYNTANTATPPNVGWMVGESGVAPAAVASGDATSLFVGDGTVGSPYQISSLNALYWIAQHSTSWDKYFIQTADIDASETATWSGGGWVPIGNFSTYFTGAYDGDSHTIDGLTISRSTTDYQGMFGVIFQGEVAGLGLTNVSIIGKFGVGAFCAYLYNSSTMTKCYSTGSVSGESSVAGLSGFVHTNSTVSQSFSRSTVAATTQVAGGLVGRFDSGSLIQNSYATGNVSAGSEYAGGLTGFIYQSTVTNCYSVGSVTGGSSLGGLAGVSNSSTVTNSFWDVDASGRSTSSGGTGKTTAQMKNGSTFSGAGWDAAVWFMGNGMNDGYPYLAWENPGGTMLPVELSSFTADVHGTNVHLSWKTATELNNHGFEVERRAIDNGKLTMNNWNTLCFTEGKGTKNALSEYSYVDRNILHGKYVYRLKQIDRDGKVSYSHEVEAAILSAHSVFALEQNYPNPFNPSTTIRYSLPANGLVTLTIYDALGREIAAPVNSVQAAGNYAVQWNGGELTNGVYFYTLRTATFSATKKLTVLK